MFNRMPPVDYVEGNQGANLRSSAAQRQQAFPGPEAQHSRHFRKSVVRAFSRGGTRRNCLEARIPRGSIAGDGAFSDYGRSLIPALNALAEWGSQYQKR